MKVSYNPQSLESINISDVILSPSLIKGLGIHFEEITISDVLYEKTYEFYHKNNFFWKSIYNGFCSDPLTVNGEIKKEEHYGLRFSITKLKLDASNYKCWIRQFSERNAHENLRGNYHCNEEQRKKVEVLREIGDEYYDCFDIISYLVNNHKKDIIEIEVWDSPENCREYYLNKALDTPMIFRKNTSAG